MSVDTQELARAFEAGALDPAAFSHRDHVAVACDMLRRYDFLEAAAKYAEGLKSLAARAGVPEKFNATVTVAFLSLIAERMRTSEHADFDDFVARNRDLLSKNVLEPWYAPERLRSDLARQVFLMPDAPRQLAGDTLRRPVRDGSVRQAGATQQGQIALEVVPLAVG